MYNLKHNNETSATLVKYYLPKSINYPQKLQLYSKLNSQGRVKIGKLEFYNCIMILFFRHQATISNSIFTSKIALVVIANLLKQKKNIYCLNTVVFGEISNPILLKSCQTPYNTKEKILVPRH